MSPSPTPLCARACHSSLSVGILGRRTRGTGELHVPEIQSMLQGIYTGCDVAGPEEGKSRGALADTKAAREELGMDFHSVEDTLRATIDSTIGARERLRTAVLAGLRFHSGGVVLQSSGSSSPTGRSTTGSSAGTTGSSRSSSTACPSSKGQACSDLCKQMCCGMYIHFT